MANENQARPKRTLLGTVALLAGLLAAPAVQSQDTADAASVPAQVDQAVAQYLSEMKGNRYTRLNADVQPLDSRMQLTPCAQPLEVEHHPRERMGGRITFKVSCSTPEGWSVRVPAVIALFDDVVVAASSIPSGTQLSGKELSLQEMDVALLYRGYYRDIDQVRGFVARRPIPAGQVLSPVVVDPANLVSKGEAVTIMAEAPGISIRAMGIALTDGALGELIQVRNTKSNKVIEGRIIAPGQIKVAL